jgi:hypothetical protein
MAKKATASKKKKRAAGRKTAVRKRAARPRKMLRCEPGFRFETIGRSQVALMRANTQGPTFKCACSTSGGCRVSIDPQDPQTITCEESGCSGTCGWEISVPGIGGVKFGSLLGARVAAARRGRR